MYQQWPELEAYTLIQYLIKTEVSLPSQVVLQIKAKASKHLSHSWSWKVSAALESVSVKTNQFTLNYFVSTALKALKSKWIECIEVFHV